MVEVPPASEPARRGLRIVTDPTRNLGASSGSNHSAASMDDLVQWAVAGEREAFDEMVRRTHRDAYGLALRLTSDEEDARDVVQDAYLRAYRSIDRFRGDAQFSTWLYRIVANCAATTTGKRRRHRHDELPDEALMVDARPENDPAAQAAVGDLRQQVDDAIRELPPRLRSVVVLRDVYDLPHDAIAEELGISVSAAKVRLHRARRRLRERVFPLPGEARHAI
jgi:RNA polymerase sigma-70 factor (ECF subfamily)